MDGTREEGTHVGPMAGHRFRPTTAGLGIASVLRSLFPLPVIAVTSALALSACDPGTSRPDVLPFPESQTLEVMLSRPEAITKLRDALVADSFPIARIDTRDTWLETPWFDRGSLHPVRGYALGPDQVKLRAWADPARPGNATLVVELVYRPEADPSRPPRLLEHPVGKDDLIFKRVKAILDTLNAEVGLPSDQRTHH